MLKRHKDMHLLELSIVKWEKIVDGTGIDDRSHDCPLCKEYAKDGCYGCPVQLRTKAFSCFQSPYISWQHHVQRHNDTHYAVRHDGIVCQTCIEHAQAELDFLKSLLSELQNEENAACTSAG